MAPEHVEALIKKALVREFSVKACLFADAMRCRTRPAPRFLLVGGVEPPPPSDRLRHENADEIDQQRPIRNPPSPQGVEGDCMQDEGILDGDVLKTERTQPAQNGGDRVVALPTDGSTTLKTFDTGRRSHPSLQPANPAFEPIRVRFVGAWWYGWLWLRRYGR